MIATYDDVLDVANDLRSSQGFYSRLFVILKEFTQDDKNELNRILKANNVNNDTVSIILFLES